MEKIGLKGWTSFDLNNIWFVFWLDGFWSIWHFKGIVCTVILRCCKPKSDQKCRSYVTLIWFWTYNLITFSGGQKGFFLQNQVLPMAPEDGPRWSWVVLSNKLEIHDIQLQKCYTIYLVLAPEFNILFELKQAHIMRVHCGDRKEMSLHNLRQKVNWLSTSFICPNFGE